MRRQTIFRHLLFACVIAPILAACGSGGSGGGSDCNPKPTIASSPPRYATVEQTYTYVTDARWSCVIALCNSVDLSRSPKGTTVDDSSDTVSWTPKKNHANQSFAFEIKTERDACGARASQKWEVRVLRAPVIDKFSSNKVQVYPGENIKLRPVFSRGKGYITDYGKVQSGKQITLKNLDASKTYELLVRNQAGTEVRETIQIDVLEPLMLEQFELSDILVTEGRSTTLKWKVSGDFSTLVIDPLGPKITGSGTLNLSPAESTTYTLTASNALGDSVSASVHLEVIPRPSIQHFTATPESATLNESVLIEASFEGGTAELQRIMDSSDQTLIEGDFDIAIDSGPLTRNQDFRLVVTNASGETTSQTISVPISGPGTFQRVAGEPRYTDGRYRGNAVNLLDGNVYLAGGYHGLTEIFDPATETYSDGPSQVERRHNFGMTIMADGRVLIAGGSYIWTGPIYTARIFDPAANTLVQTTRLPDHATNVREAVLLADGRILLYHQNGVTQSGRGEGVVLFDPLTETYTTAAPMNNGHLNPNIHLLDDGRVIFLDSQAPEASEIYDPVSDTFEVIADMVIARENFVSAKLLDGRILIVGGGSNTAEIFDPVTQTFRLLASPTEASHAAVTLLDGRVLIAGGFRSEIFDPVTETFTQTGGVLDYGAAPTLTLLDDGRVLNIGGCSCSHEIYTP